MPEYKAERDGFTGVVHCHEPGNTCHVSFIETDSFESDVEFTHFRHTNLSPDKRKEYHDDILVRLTDEVNRLIKEAQKQKRNKRLSIMEGKDGFFFCWIENRKPSDRTGFEEITRDNLAEKFELVK